MNNNKNDGKTQPNIIGASTLFGIIVGASLSGFLGQFELWIPIFGTTGVILGFYLRSNEAKVVKNNNLKN
tara:strand:+ start:254 stop:463 length:210 start_codon:yes stop_codon:yes gene_type:complete